MLNIILYISIFSLISLIDGKLYLKIIKRNEDIINPATNIVEEIIGNRFSLMCELMSTSNESLTDDQLLWIRDIDNLHNDQILQKLLESTNETYRYTTQEINKSEKKFDPLQEKDSGRYICISEKFKLKEIVTVVAKPGSKLNENQMILPPHCSNHTFQCASNGLCIIKHYICDGYSDCKDGSDESVELCGKPACRNKIPCDDGRCIPSNWCCDKRHDPNCEVTVRHECCRKLPNSYEEMEYAYKEVNHNIYLSHYLSILFCVFSAIFAMVTLLFILMKLFIALRKAILKKHRRHEAIALRNQAINRLHCFNNNINNNNNNNNNGRISIVNEALDVRDPLLLTPMTFNVGVESLYDQPPSYVDIIRNNSLMSGPPPPYQSYEALHTLGNTDSK